MQNGSEAASPDGDAWRPEWICPACGNASVDWARYCTRCGLPMPSVEMAAKAEIGHIAYLLQQLEWWRARHLVAPTAEAELRSEYVTRQKMLQDQIRSHPETRAPEPQPEPSASPSRSAPILPPLPQTARPETAASPLPPLPQMPVTPSAVGREAPAAVLHRVVRPEPHRAAPPVPPSPPLTIGIRNFFQEHGLKVLFALATVLVIVALRSMIAWDWVGAIVMRLIPAVPLALTAMFWLFGQKTRRENPWAALVYSGLAAALIGFDVIAINKYWLLSALPVKSALFAACLAATAATAALLLRWREIPYLHLFQIGALSSLYFGLQLLRGSIPADDFRPLPILLFGAGYLLYAAVCLAAAQAVRHSAPDPAAVGETVQPGVIASPGLWALSWTFWAHIAMATVLVLSAADLALRDVTSVSEFAPLALLAGLIYAAGAQFLTDARMVYVSGGLLAVSGLLWLSAPGLSVWPGFGLLLLALSTAALVMAVFNGRRAARDREMADFAQAYRRVAQIGVGLATILLWGRTLLLLAGQAAHPAGEAPSSVLLALLCGLFCLIFARTEQEPAFVYGALSTWAIATLNGLFWLQAPLGAYALTLAVYGAALSLVSTVLARPRATQQVGEPPAVPVSPFDLTEWVEPFTLSGQVAVTLAVFLAALLPLNGHLPAEWLWTTATLGLGAVFYALSAQQEHSSQVAFVSLGCAAYVSALLTWRLWPGALRLADYLAPFTLLSAGAAYLTPPAAPPRPSLKGMGVTRPHTSTTTGEEVPSADASERQENAKRVSEAWAVWREPLAVTALLAIALSLADGLAALLTSLPGAHVTLSVLPSLVGAVLVCAARREPGVDRLRTPAIGALCSAGALEVAGLCASTGGAAGWTAALWRDFGFGLVLLAWFWWLVGQALPRMLSADVWGEELSLGGLATAFCGALVLMTSTVGVAPPVGTAFWLFESSLVGAFALFCLHLWTQRQENALAASLLVAVLMGVANALGLSPGVPFAVPIGSLIVLVAAGSYLLLARRLDNADVARYSTLLLLGGYALFLSWRATHLAPLDAHLSDAIWVVGGLALAWEYRRTARWSGRSEYAYIAALTLTGCYLRAITLFWQPPPQWHALVLLPFLTALYLGGTLVPEAEETLLGEPLRRTALALSGIALLWSAGNGDGLLPPDGLRQPASPWLVTLTLLAYGVAYAAVTAHRRTPGMVTASSLTLTAAYLHSLLTRTALFHAAAPISGPYFAFLAVQAAVVWLAAGWYLARSRKRDDLAAPLLALAGGLNLLSAAIGLFTVHTPHQGSWTILTLAWAGAVWSGLWLLDQGEICLHVGAWNLLAAWGLIVYDKLGAGSLLLDIYLLPVGLYLIGFGYLANRRQQTDSAHALWWAGLLSMLLPAFLAFWRQGGSFHTLLLLGECLVAVLWGVGQRIRAFVLAGLLFAAAYAASSAIGRLPDTLSTLASLITGVGLFVMGFYALTHRETVQRWAAALEGHWQAWQAWR